MAAYFAGLLTLVFIDTLAVYATTNALMNSQVVIFFTEIAALAVAVTLAAFLHTRRHSRIGQLCLGGAALAWWLVAYFFAPLTFAMVPLALLVTVAAAAALMRRTDTRVIA